MSQAIVLLPQARASAAQCRSSSIRPLGMAGPIISTAAVCGPDRRRAARPGSRSQPLEVGFVGTKRGTPPASRTRLIRPA